MADAKGFMAAFLHRGRFLAITIGDSTLFRDGFNEALPSLLLHEVTHVAQARRWGPIWPLAYAFGWFMGLCGALASGPLPQLFRNAYRMNPFEVEARDRAELAKHLDAEVLENERRALNNG